MFSFVVDPSGSHSAIMGGIGWGGVGEQTLGITLSLLAVVLPLIFNEGTHMWYIFKFY